MTKKAKRDSIECPVCKTTQLPEALLVYQATVGTFYAGYHSGGMLQRVWMLRFQCPKCRCLGSVAINVEKRNKESP